MSKVASGHARCFVPKLTIGDFKHVHRQAGDLQ
jgi:hypothetical protein